MATKKQSAPRRDGEAAEAGALPPSPGFDRRLAIRGWLSNAQDQRVFEQLTEQPLGSLAIDGFAQCMSDADPRTLRAALAVVYLRASLARRRTQATKRQIKEVEKALAALEKGYTHLHHAIPPEYTSLYAAAGFVPENLRGNEGLNEFALTCQKNARKLVLILLELKDALRAETLRPRRRGERKKRLRTIVDELASWWRSLGRKVTVRNVTQSRKVGIGKRKRDVLGHEGEFLDLSRALLTRLDKFNDSEVVATVKTVAWA
jgi:hypothetical protein